MEFRCRQIRFTRVPWNSMEYPMEFHGTLRTLKQISLSSMEFHGTSMAPFKWHQGSTEFHWTLPVPNQISPSCMEFHGTWRAPFQMTPGLHGIPWNIPWNSKELCRHQIKCHKVPWNSMELWDYHFNWHQVLLDFHWIFHGTLELPNQMSSSFMEFRGNWGLLI